MPTSPPRSSPRGAYAKTAERKREIILAATAVFAARGYHGGSLRDIARELDMSLATLAYHFPAKTDLLREVLEHTDAQGVELFEKADEVGFAATVLATVERNFGRPELLRLFSVLSSEATSKEHPAHQWFVERYANLIDLFAQQIAYDQRHGRIAIDRDPAELAETLICAWDGMQLQWLLRPDFDMRARMGALLVALLPPVDEVRQRA